MTRGKPRGARPPAPAESPARRAARPSDCHFLNGTRFDRARVADVNDLHEAPQGWELRDTDGGTGRSYASLWPGSPSG
ncbi:hypothetical protein GCM10027161_64690 [Microbispora hainanensis]